MFAGATEIAPTVSGDSVEFMGKVQAIVKSIARYYEPQRLYVIRIDNWFGPKWMHFAGKFTAGKGFAVGVHRSTLRVPPFVPHRVITERVFAGPNYEEVARPPLHIECASSDALHRRIADLDREAAFVWFSGQSDVQKRGSIMVYLPRKSEALPSRRDGPGRAGAFYVGFSKRDSVWQPATLRGVSRGEVEHLEGGAGVTGSASPLWSPRSSR